MMKLMLAVLVAVAMALASMWVRAGPTEEYGFGLNAYEARNYTFASMWFRKAAAQGFADAMCFEQAGNAFRYVMQCFRRL